MAQKIAFKLIFVFSLSVSLQAFASNPYRTEFEAILPKLREEALSIQAKSPSAFEEWIRIMMQPFVDKYAFAIPNDAAIAAIAKYRLPVLEIGAGLGYWASLLRQSGVDVVAYDRAISGETS